MSERLLVAEPARIVEFLGRSLPGWKRRTLERRLRAGCVRVNGATVRRNEVLAPGDEVTVAGEEEGEAGRPPAGIAILHQDEALVAIDKPAGLLSVGTERERGRTALALVRDWLARPGRPARLWPVHRLDRETSGVLLFARTLAARDALQARWYEAEKVYLAIVAGRPDPPDGTIEQPLFEDGDLRVRVADRPGAKPARTRYRTLRSLPNRALLEVELETGRRHQIRAHLAWLGCPVVGDPRQGGARGRMGLHALRLAVAHPADGRRLLLEAAPPRAFAALLSLRSR